MSGLYPLLAALLFLNACQTSQPDSVENDEKAEPTQESMQAQQMPMDLWTPARRQVNASYFFMIAEYESLQNNRSLAKKFYEDAYNLDPNAYIGVKWLASKALDDPESALLQAKRMVLLYPKVADIHLLYGQLLSGVGMLDEAIDAFLKAKKLDEDRLEPYLGLITIYRSQGNIKKAIALTKEMLDQDSSFADGWALLSKLHLAMDQKKQALPPAKRAYDLQSNDPEKIHLYALTLELNGDSKKAVNLYEALFRMNPTNDELIARMVDLYKQIGSLEDALKLLQDADERTGQIVPGTRLQMAFIYWELERYEEAAKVLDELARQQPESARVLYMSGLGREKIGRNRDAIHVYQQIPEDSEFYVHGAARMIHLYRQANNFSAAEDLAQKLIQSGHERSVDFYLVLASIYSDQEDFASAVKILKEGVEQYPDRVDLLFMQGVNLERQGKLKECIRVMRQVIQVDPSHSAAFNYLGYLFAERGENLKEAESLIRKALDLKPDDGYYLDSLGWVYYQRGEYQKALEILKQANEQTPNEGVILEHIGDCYKALGNEKKATDYYEMATKGRVDDRDQERIMSKFREMKADVDS
ncbi:MAG: tetratricopeptide repeat protein [Oligoflexus sp.]